MHIGGKMLLFLILLMACDGPVVRAKGSKVSSPIPYSQSDQPVKALHKVLVCILGGFETKGKTAEQCKAMGGRVEESPELSAT